MAKSIGKNASEEELKELEDFLKQFPEYKRMQNVTTSLKGGVKQRESLVKERELNTGLEELWYRIKKSDETGSPVQRNITSSFYWKWVSAAAVLIAILTSGLIYGRHSLSADFFTKTILRHIVVPYGETKELTLPDGTKVKLNAGSRFTYPETFSKANREVDLKGEGFFEVTKNPQKPFLVHTSSLTIKVLGTIFNLKAYPDDKNIETTLLRGKVQVELKALPEKNIILLPNEKLTVTNDLLDQQSTYTHKGSVKPAYHIKKLPVNSVDMIKETAWLSNRIVFTNENFEEVAKQIERKYNVQLIFEDPVLKNEQLSGVLEKESLENALSIMKMTAPFNFKIEGRVVRIAHK